MLYSEFVNGTGCKDTEKNYKIYKDLEIMYMNSDMTKQEIYEYGKKLVDNSKSEKQLQFEAEVQKEIEQKKKEIEWHKRDIEVYQAYTKLPDTTKTEKEDYKERIKLRKKWIREAKERIKMLKWTITY